MKATILLKNALAFSLLLFLSVGVSAKVPTLADITDPTAIDGNATEQTVNLTGLANAYGTAIITVKVTDNGTSPDNLSVEKNFTVTDKNVNHAPTFTTTSPAIVSVNVDSPYSYKVGISDVDNDVLTLRADSTVPITKKLQLTNKTQPTWLNIIRNDDGTITLSGTPTKENVRDYHIFLTLTDQKETVYQTFTITVVK